MNSMNPVDIEAVELRRVGMPLTSPFRTSFGTQTERDVLLVRVITGQAEGWAECVATADPLYSSEFTDGAHRVITDHLLPRLFHAGPLSAEQVAELLKPVRGHRMAKAAVETAVLDAQLKAAGIPLGRCLGATATHVEAGVSVSIHDSVPELLDAVAGYLDAGYRRIKLKIQPGWDTEPVAAVRERFGEDVLLQVDANAAYTRSDARHLAQLDAFGLLLVEQPLDEEDMAGHAELARVVRTPICLDESIVSAQAAYEAIRTGACAIVNIKPGRVGGYLEARRVHDVCAAAGIPVWAGGMLETGLGRAANLALAGLPNFTLPSDISASDRYFEQDLTEPITMTDDGHIQIPTTPGIGVAPIPEVLAELTVSTLVLKP
ncbi:o-succinylbenzoate synthase [Streptomyces qinglanensis]|uniref:o-succinylbenzoate synthase n=1 Tax=Streptomyces qinglanensis TaxID=943816 RepID=A0A1H9SFL6_9ACTN|nr:o-succinylbenzoate synthase [Streptomyces qinglanensis]SER83019.1 O-succinylbenzoate synthase [Streptomyces qinglanensis]